MKPELLDAILGKAVQECNISFVYLYNWGEPFLNPMLPELIKVVNAYCIPCGVSSNLNIRRNIDRVVAANPANFVISTSGFSQFAYAKTHRGGDIQKVKKNMLWLAETKQSTASKTRIEVNFIRYLGNLDELVLMRSFALSLGFFFRQSVAALFPLEKLILYLSDPVRREEMRNNEPELLDVLVFPYEELMELAGPFKRFPCSFLEDQVVLNTRGEVQLCPLVYDPKRFTIVDFLGCPLQEIQKLKRDRAFCRLCIDMGIHTLGLKFGPDLKPAVFKRVVGYYADAGVDLRKAHQTPGYGRVNQTVRLMKQFARESLFLQNLHEKISAKFPHLDRFTGNTFS
jgi:MoaA/NifB/PqqE/SkfB family radical SAM enzyme